MNMNGKTIEYLTDIELEQLNHFLISSELTEGSHDKQGVLLWQNRRSVEELNSCRVVELECFSL